MLSFRFDDAYASQLDATRILENKGMHASIYCITGFVGTTGYMSWEDIRMLADKGHEIGSHTVTHPACGMLCPTKLIQELHDSKATLEKHTILVASFAWPYGFSPLCGDRIAQKYYTNAVDYPWLRRFRLNGRTGDRYSLVTSEPKSAEECIAYLSVAVRKKLWLIACFHRIENSVNRFSLSIDEFEKIVQYASQMRQKGLVEVVTVSEGAKRLQ